MMSTIDNNGTDSFSNPPTPEGDAAMVEVHLDFDILASAYKGDTEHYSNYVSKSGNQLDTFEVMSGQGMHLMHAKMIPCNNGIIHIKAKQQYIYFIFVIECPRFYSTDDHPDRMIEVGELCQLAFFVNKGTILSFQWKEKRPHNIFEVSISVDYLSKLLPTDHFLYDRLQKALLHEDSYPLFDRPMTIGPKLKATLHDMVYCPYSGSIKSLYIKGKLIEILALQQFKHDRLHQENNTVHQHEISETERNRMFELRDILLQHIDHVPSFNELAKMVGTNECYLKQNFKRVFGTTVYGYVKQIKMEKAKKLLVQDKKRINEVAQLIGYKHANHFTNAFKKYYGYTPNSLVTTKA